MASKTSRRTTLNDLAGDLGLSANTVSRALSGKDGVSERTRTLVLTEARRSGYLATDLPAPPPATGSRTIAVTVPSATHQFSSELLGAIESGARAAGYSLDVFATGEDEGQEQQAVQTIAAGDIAGAIVVGVQGGSNPWIRAAAAGLPLVAVSRELPGLSCDVVTADNEAGSYAAVRHLLGEGCRRLIEFEEDLTISTIDARRRGFARAVAEVGDAESETVLVPTRRFESSEPRWRAAEAYRACLALLDTGRSFDAVSAGDDFFALGVLKALTERGLGVPEDVRLVGYGDHPYAGWLTPTLSSVRIPTRLIGELASSLLLQRISEGPGAAVRRVIKPELIIRGSSVRHPPRAL